MNRRQLLQTLSLMLGGAAVPSLARALQAAKGARRAPEKPVFTPAVRKQVEILSELIIPTTDTPGAIAAGVPDFVEMMVAEWYNDTERSIFYQGLEDLDRWCRERHDRSFLDCDQDQQTEALLWSEQQATSYTGSAPASFMDRHHVDENTPFFNKIKELVVVGYYSSEVGARQEHRYHLMTPHFDGDYDLAKVDGRQWSF